MGRITTKQTMLLLLVAVLLAACGSPKAAPTVAPVDTRPRAADDMVMVYVPAGEFAMGSTGSDPEANDDEKPAHTVYLDAFWIDRTEVTNAQYRKCVDAHACSEARCRPGEEGDFSADDQPVVCASWEDAVAYCKWAGARLPTEAEWEKAARGTDGRTYPWGNTFDGRLSNFCDRRCPLDWQDKRADDGYAYTAPVGSYPKGASPYGALDMAGNVPEWVSDWYSEGYYSVSPASNPQGPDVGTYRVLRGGGFSSGWGSGEAWSRDYYDAGLRGPYYFFFGFRCAVSPGK